MDITLEKAWTPIQINKNVLIIQCNKIMHPDDEKHIYNLLMQEAQNGIMLLPSCCEVVGIFTNNSLNNEYT